MQHSIAWLLNDISHQWRYAFDKRARALGVTRPQWRVLLALARFDGQTQTELADRLDVERISVGRMVDRLVESGLVERCADPGDRRVWRLRLLPAAHDIVAKLSEIGAGLEAEILGPVPADQRMQLVEILEMIRCSAKGLRDDTGFGKEVA